MTRTEFENKLATICDNNPYTTYGFCLEYQFLNGRFAFSMKDNEWNFGGFAITLMDLGPNDEVSENHFKKLLTGLSALSLRMCRQAREDAKKMKRKERKTWERFMTNASYSMMYVLQHIEEMMKQQHEREHCVLRCVQNP